MKLLNEGRNCWCVSRAEKGAFLIDGAAYFEALADAIDQARRTIMIAAWDIDSRIQLRRRRETGTNEETLGDFLNAKTKRTPGLQVYLLTWDFPMLYVREREWLPLFNIGWKTHRRIHFELDSEHPIGASQHQKIVVIDDRLAFCGGFDLSNSRWDTPRHRPDDPRRKNPDGNSYSPFHDIQMVVKGDAALKLSELFRQRWKRAGGDPIEHQKDGSANRWPKDLRADLQGVSVAVARTFPPFKERREVREIENLYRDGIGAAEKSIYIENQYLTAGAIADAISRKLSQRNGPEVVIVLPRKSSGWLEQSTMDALRARILKRLHRADRYHRLRVFYPACGDGLDVYVHSKLMIVDDRLAVVGSANLSNRSMGLDSECCLAVEAQGHDGAEAAIAELRTRLLAEHTGASPESVSSAYDRHRSLTKTIESLQGVSRRRLADLDYEAAVPFDTASIIPDHELLDPEAPVEFDQLLDHFSRPDRRRAERMRIVAVAAVFLLLLGLGAAWQWTPLAEWINIDQLASWADGIRGHPVYYPAVLGAYIIGGLVMFPLTLMVGATAMVFPPGAAAALALGGALLSALTGYLLGSMSGKRFVRSLAGQRINRLSRQMARKGVLSVAVVRNIPLAPYTIVNLIAGASHIKLTDFLIGTALGMLPGILSITIFADRLLRAFKQPSWANFGVVVILAAVLIGGFWWLKNRLSVNRE